MTLQDFLLSAAWRAECPDPERVRGRLDADRIAAELHDLGHHDLATEVSPEDHPIDIARWAWLALAERA